ncbi:MAG: hypothetical protein GX589_00965 [Deltaproteobacteria bacterium]|nr:hypothetical protein [Deltaproteobacteria bacterium]
MRSLKGSLSRDKGVDSACLSELSSALHRIKGGAGFFGLNHIATHAATLEELLLKPLEDVQRNLDRIQQTLKELEGCVEEIPSGAELEEKRRA